MSTQKKSNHNTEINTGGGSYIEGDVNTGGGDFVGRDKIIYGDEIHIHKDSNRPPASLPTRIPEPRSQQLIGRETELDWVCQRLQSKEEVAIAAIRGIGGVGKTELAIAAVRRLVAHFEERIMWVDCGANDTFAIQARMAAALGVVLESEDIQIRADILAVAFRQQPMLVVLDDVRRSHLTSFNAILPPRPPCAVLITSRRDDLPLPILAIIALDVLSPETSMGLFSNLISEAVAAEPESASAITELLEHIPLALILAARRAERLARRRDTSGEQPLATLLNELKTRRIQVLDQGGDPDRPDLSIIITFDISYDDLDAPDQTRLRRLGVFARNEFEIRAIQAVWEEADENSARQALDRLMNAGLLEEVDKDTWWMHDLLREYAAERLSRADSADKQTTHLNYAYYWRRCLLNNTLRTIDNWHRLTVYRPEIEQVADWLLSNWRRDPELLITFVHLIGQVFPGYAFSQAEQLLVSSQTAVRETLQLASTEGERKTSQLLQAITDARLADLLRSRGENNKAEQLYRNSINTLIMLGYLHPLAVTQSKLATMLHVLGRSDEAEKLNKESLRVFKALGDEHQIAVVQSNLVEQLRLQTEHSKTAEILQESLAIFESLSDDHSLAITRVRLADLLNIQQEGERAESLYRNSLDILETIGDEYEAALVKIKLANLLRTRQQYDEAKQLIEDSIDTFKELGDSHHSAFATAKLGEVCTAQGEYKQANEAYRTGLEICQSSHDIEGKAIFYIKLGILRVHEGKFDQALEYLQKTRQIYLGLQKEQKVAEVDGLITQAQGIAKAQGKVTLNELLDLIRLARQGDEQAEQRAKELCHKSSASDDPSKAVIGQSLLHVLEGTPPETALADLPDDLRTYILEVLNAES